jgi:hypothetical protein
MDAGDMSFQVALGLVVPRLVRRALPRRNFIQGAPLCPHPHVGVAREHGARDVPSDAHDSLSPAPYWILAVACASAICRFSNNCARSATRFRSTFSSAFRLAAVRM